MRLRHAFFGVVFAVSAMVATAAQAITYNVNFDGGSFDFTALVTTDGGNNVTSIAGLAHGAFGSDSITSVVPIGNPGWIYDNLFDGAAAVPVTNGGLLFSTLGGVIANLYSVGNQILVSFTPGVWSDYDPGTGGTLTVAAVPVPAAGLLAVPMFAFLGLLAARAKKRRKAGPMAFASALPAEAA